MTSPASDTTHPTTTGDPAWHALDAEEVLETLRSVPTGLSAEEAAHRLAVHGPNRLPQGRREPAVVRLLRQFDNLLIYVLLGAAALAAGVGHGIDALVILAVVVVNALIGFVQESKAESALDSIRRMIDPAASVLRGGRRATVPADTVVPGDLVLLEAGDRVPADVRLLKTNLLRLDEAILTGESVPVDKGPAPVEATAPLGDRTCMAFSGTFVAAGQGVGIAVATGARTELGRISRMIGTVERLTTPLVREMNRFARQITVGVLAASVVVFAYAALIGSYAVTEAFMAVVGLAVAAIPEGLPAVMTITLAVGVQRMARRNAIIRRLPAVETLGSVSVICSDKTGTLTRNEMTVGTVVLTSGRVTVTGSGYRPEGAFAADGRPIDAAADPVLERLTLAGLLCGDAELSRRGEDWIVDGDPMEGALLSLAAKAGHDVAAARARFPRLDVIPFDSRHRYMATLHADDGGEPIACAKGAPERILSMCAAAAAPEGRVVPLDAARWSAEVEALAADGQRVLALAVRTMPIGTAKLRADDIAHGLTLLGLVGLIDPPRAEAVAAIAECRSAGIDVKMITGDHAATAGAIAARLGLGDDRKAISGPELDRLDDEAFASRARSVSVFARTSPEHKLRLVEALQRDGSVVAMTGDGVNDAPALKRADVGVAMGRKGTEAAKDASEMVLADDNFASIVAAVREGRTVYDNMIKVIAWTLPTNGGEALTIILAILLGLTLPVTPVQILWVNMVTAVALGLTLAFEPTEAGTMRRPPRAAGRRLLSGRLLWRIALVSALMVAGAFGVYAWAVGRGLSVEAARTLVVNTLVVMEIFYLFSVRYVHGSSLTLQGVLGTPAVLAGVGAVVAAQLVFTYLPVLAAVFDTRPVSFTDGLVVVGLGMALLILVEAEKRVAVRLGFSG